MKLYGSIASPYVARVVMCARAKGLALEPQTPPGGGIKSAEYLQLNPLGKMPVLDVDGHCIAESEVICEYLEDAHTGRSIRPEDLLERARARLLSRVLDLYVLGQTGAFYRNLNPAKRNPVETQAAVAALQSGLKHLEHFLGPGPYAVGRTLTLADCSMLTGIALVNTSIVPAFGLENPVQVLPKLGAWWEQMGEDPLCVQVLEEWSVAYQEFWKRRFG